MTQAYMACENNHRGARGDNFCKRCGSRLQEVCPLPYTGKDPRQGIYRITIVVEHEFRSVDHVTECADKSYLGEEEIPFRQCKPDSRVAGSEPVKVDFVRSTVGPKTHPYVCRYCRDESDCAYSSDNPSVSSTTEGRCEDCGEQDWVKR